MFVKGENICVFPWRPGGTVPPALVPSRAEGSFSDKQGQKRRAGQRAPGWSRGAVAGAERAPPGRVTLPACTTADGLRGSRDGPQAGTTLKLLSTVCTVRVHGLGWVEQGWGRWRQQGMPASRAGQPEELLAMPAIVRPWEAVCKNHQPGCACKRCPWLGCDHTFTDAFGPEGKE